MNSRASWLIGLLLWHIDSTLSLSRIRSTVGFGIGLALAAAHYADVGAWTMLGLAACGVALILCDVRIDKAIIEIEGNDDE